MPPQSTEERKVPIVPALAVLILIIAVITSGFFFYQFQEQQIKTGVTNELTSIAILKAEQIATWRADRISDASMLTHSVFFIEGVRQYMESSDEETRENILVRLREVNASRFYDNVILTDSRGNIQMSLDPALSPLPPEVNALLSESLGSGKPAVTDLYLDALTQRPRMDVIAPLEWDSNGRTEQVGAVILQIDPEESLYPLIQSWPVPSRTAESLLVERRGDSVIFLNELKHKENTALQLTYPLTQEDLPAVRAVLGKTGAFQGRDYRNVDVISVIEPVKGSSWFLVAKVDADEAFSPSDNVSLLIFIIVTGTLAGILVAAGFYWQRRQKYYYQSLYHVEAERGKEEQRNRERLETLVKIGEMEAATEKDLTAYILDAACRLTESQLAFLGVMSRHETVMDITAWPGSVMDQYAVDQAPITFSIEKDGIWADAVRTRQPVIVNDYAASLPGKKELFQGNVPITRFVSVPITEGQNIVMVCAVANKNTEYTQIDIDQLALLMQGVWIRLQRRRADEELYRKHTDLEAAYEEIAATEEELRSNYEQLEESQRAIRESEQKFREMVINLDEGFYNSTMDGVLKDHNPAFNRIFGFDINADLRGLHVPDFWQNAEDQQEYIRELMEKGSIRNFIIPAKRTGGESIVVMASSHLVYDAKGTPVRIEGTFLDITEQQQAEEEARATSQNLHDIIEFLPDATFVIDREKRVIAWNRAIEEMTGINKEEILGKGDFAYSVPFYGERRPILIDLVFEPLAEIESKYIGIIRKDSTIFAEAFVPGTYGGKGAYLSGKATALFDRHGTLIGAIESIRDITDRKMNERTLQESEVRFRHISEMITDFAYSCRAAPGSPFIIDWLTGAVYEITGYTAKEIHDLTCWRPLVISEDLPVFDRNVVGLSPGESARSEIRILRKDGRVVWLASFAECVTDPEDPAYHRLYGGCRDITERKESDERQKDLVSELEQKNAELERFTYTVSHDLKSPLITIRGFAGLLEEDAQKGDMDRLARDVSRISDAAEKMQNLLNDLLTLSRIGRIVHPPEDVPLGTIAREAAELLAIPLEQEGAKIEIVRDLPVVHVDHTRMREVFTNLIENAIKFRKAGEAPVIQIGMREDQGGRVFFVRDFGIGIDPRYRSRIFRLFEKLDGKTEGTGVGLAIVKRIIEVHGGKVWAESAGLEQGTTICFTLPGVSGTDTDKE